MNLPVRKIIQSFVTPTYLFLIFIVPTVGWDRFPSYNFSLLAETSPLISSSAGNLDDPEFKEGWKKYSKDKDARPLKAWFQSHPDVNIRPCKLSRTLDFEGLQYFSIKCQDEILNGFFYSGGATVSNPDSIDSIRVKGPVKIGKVVYWDLSFSSKDLPVNSSPGRLEKPNRRTRLPEKPPDNLGLQYFLSLARRPAHRPAPDGKEVFFDSSCPLVFLGKDGDFYWDKAIYFSFQASCFPQSPYSWVRIKADFSGNLVLDNKPSQSLKEGERFLAKLKIQSIEKDKIVWSEAELFHE
ncbi:hypothetical protein LEP1GSC058_1689 [Leptospira fainei serovar Hurstbridge str. BUT 6]|uniref:Uncharacterized protein n=1 Tax=Leptospira fainei serovar Hurstbridge str. BUT 6 TaxID=1193011 RepID=S3V205_9LEPT|nr:hypothetical protein [Leptospira fainei]EPG74649.1 hypothetical protein LEP1GSC058_1689 [Leptospira fainei serovar Hurstbridge str. BUT 6]